MGGGGVEVDVVGGAVVDGQRCLLEVVHVAIFWSSLASNLTFVRRKKFILSQFLLTRISANSIIFHRVATLIFLVCQKPSISRLPQP